MTYPNELTNPAQANWPVRVNEAFKSLRGPALYAPNDLTTTGLTLGYFGGYLNDSVTISDGTVGPLAASDTSYIVAHRTTGVVTHATTTTNWNDTTTYARLFSVDTGGSSITTTRDWRLLEGGVFGSGIVSSLDASAVTYHPNDLDDWTSSDDPGNVDDALDQLADRVSAVEQGVVGEQSGIQFQDEGSNLGTSGTVTEVDFTGAGVSSSRVGNKVTVSVSGGGGGATELKWLTFTSNTGTTSDVDPGSGIFQWNNGTQGSSTKLFFDNSTADGVSVTAFFAVLGTNGTLFLQQSDDSTRWQIWELDTATADSGYYEFTVTLLAKSVADIQDDKTCYCNFSKGPGSGGSNMARVTVSDSFTRPNDTNPYTAGDAVMDSTSAPTMMEFTGMAQASGGYGVILSANLYQSAQATTKGDFILWLYDTVLSTIPNDNAALANSDAESLTLVGSVYFPGTSYALSTNSTAGAGGNLMTPSGPVQVDYKCVGTSLYGLLTLATAAGYTPIAQEIFTVKLSTEQET